MNDLDIEIIEGLLAAGHITKEEYDSYFTDPDEDHFGAESFFENE